MAGHITKESYSKDFTVSPLGIHLKPKYVPGMCKFSSKTGHHFESPYPSRICRSI